MFYCFALLFVTMAPPAFAHVSERALVLLLPTDVYITVGVTLVALTILVSVFLPAAFVRRLFSLDVKAQKSAPKEDSNVFGRLLHIGIFLLLALLIIVGFLGPRDPVRNLLPLSIFTLWWICFPIAVAAFGNIWPWINPWSGPMGFLPNRPLLILPHWIASWPALGMYILAGVYALTDVAPTDPARLAWVVCAYWVFTFVLSIIFGRERLDQYEAFTLFFRLIAKLSPLNSRPFSLRFPGKALIDKDNMDVSLAVFCITILAIGSFDGLNETFWWVVKLGLNPLEFPGRSAVAWKNRFGLVGGIVLLNAVFAGIVWLGLAIISRTTEFRRLYCHLSVAILPIALGYHLAHFLTAALLNLQHTLQALTDPLDSGANLLRLTNRHVTSSMFNQLHTVRAIWMTQAAAIVIAHMLAIIMSHAIALKAFGSHRLAVLSQIPIAAFMVLYTLFGLWLLASPTAL